MQFKTTNRTDEAAIVAGCQRGEDWARRALFEQHHRSIFRFLVAQCRNPETAEDLTQETFLRAYEAIPRFRGEARVSSWMTRIALNCMYGAGRRRDRDRRNLEQIHDDESRGGWVRPRCASDDSQLERDLVWRGLARLDGDAAAVIVLHDIEGLGYREIAESLEIAVGTVGSRLSRARVRLREAIIELSRVPEEIASHGHQTSETGAPMGAPDEEAAPDASRGVVWSE